ncbi:hypothetical protein AHF37_00757 [Paragonimus kellicotti]|nr:hypothetical protein AHF37_00757 [Paragonimus kellicotti]
MSLENLDGSRRDYDGLGPELRLPRLFSSDRVYVRKAFLVGLPLQLMYDPRRASYSLAALVSITTTVGLPELTRSNWAKMDLRSHSRIRGFTIGLMSSLTQLNRTTVVGPTKQPRDWSPDKIGSAPSFGHPNL